MSFSGRPGVRVTGAGVGGSGKKRGEREAGRQGGREGGRML